MGRVSRGVRGIDLAAEDFYSRVALLDARLIAGSQLLFFELDTFEFVFLTFDKKSVDTLDS